MIQIFQKSFVPSKCHRDFSLPKRFDPYRSNFCLFYKVDPVCAFYMFPNGQIKYNQALGQDGDCLALVTKAYAAQLKMPLKYSSFKC